jgi:putative selenium metabolism protein SsnA
MKRLIENLCVWDGSGSVLDRGSILIDDGRIEAVGPGESCSETQTESVDERIDGDGKLAIPGLINAHTHLYSGLARGMSLSGFAPTTFTEILEQLWWRLDKALDAAAIRASALVGAMEATRCGVTTLIDHHASPNAIPGALDLLREVVCEQVGLRGAFCYELSDRDGGGPASQGIDENLRFLRSLSRTDDTSAALFGLHAAFTLSDGTLEKVAAGLPEGSGVHVHVAEGPEDETISVEQHGVRVIERLDRFGLLRQKSILAHCLHLNDEEKDLVAKREAIVVHNPRSNMNNAVGLFDLDGFLSRGALVGLGTDGLGANMLSELFTAGILQKHGCGDARAAPLPQVAQLLFTGNARIAERLFGTPVGRIEAGRPADVVLIDYAAPTPLTGENVLGHLLFGMAVHTLRVSDVFVAGRPVLRAGRFIGIDEAAAYAQAREQASRLWNRIG